MNVLSLFSLRILPHHQNTGGFFVAVLEKIHLLPWESLKGPLSTTESCDNKSSAINSENTMVTNDGSNNTKTYSPERKRRKTRGFCGYREDPFVFFKESEPLWPSIRYVKQNLHELCVCIYYIVLHVFF